MHAIVLHMELAIHEKLVVAPGHIGVRLQLWARRVTLPDSGVWKKIVSATASAVSKAATTGIHRSDNTVTAETQHAITALGFPSP